MLSKLLKYEFKASRRIYGGLYLAILAAATLLGAFFRMPENLISNTPIAIMMIIYLALGVALAVITIYTIIHRFTGNLLGREGYLMHTLPVSTGQLILSKLLSSMVWLLCSILVLLLSFALFSLFGTFHSSEIADLLHELSAYRSEFGSLLGQVLHGYGFALVLKALEWLVSLACSILCLYTACMIGHLFKRYSIPAGIAAFVVLNIAQNQLLNLLPYNNEQTGLNLVFSTTAGSSGTVYAVTGNHAYVWFVLAALAADVILCAAYFAAANWLMQHKLELE